MNITNPEKENILKTSNNWIKLCLAKDYDKWFKLAKMKSYNVVIVSRDSDGRVVLDYVAQTLNRSKAIEICDTIDRDRESVVIVASVVEDRTVNIIYSN